MAWTDDPVRDYARYEAEQQAWLESRPICDICGEHIQDDTYYVIEGKFICPGCLEEEYARSTDDFER